MSIINIQIKNKIAVCPKRYVISANSNYVIDFDFDSEWTDTVKTARFLFDFSCVDVIFTGNRVSVPRIPECKTLSVGVFTDKLSSTAAEIGCITSVAHADGKDDFDFTKSQYDQIVELLNETEMRQIKSISRNGSIVTVEYTNNESDSFELNDGNGVKSADVDEEGNLTMTLTDESVLQCGNVSMRKSEWILLNTVTLDETVDEVTISKKSNGQPFSVDEMFIRVNFKASEETTENTNVVLREYRLPKSPLSTQGIFENVLRPNTDIIKSCYMKAAGCGNCFTVHTPSNLGDFCKIAMSEVMGSSVKGIAGVTFTAAANTGRIAKGTTFTIYGRA
ncbi:MAG: hypothetical protein NC122_10065 [Faecalibacterium sp.]|nr:hypothetical protein [Ruminococcus sp.]MCM1392600.1 hypothetical protein [Ruminococcus sp.]MCM1486535.1 hypothetical protein [Faecalibacterium sp.]